MEDGISGSDAYRFDYVIVGGGSTGCVVAARLSENPELKVLLVEAGPSDWHPLIHMPSGEAFMIGGSLDWKFKSEPESSLGNYEIPLPRGRVLGGSSSINGQVYVRGHHADYDEWEQLGCEGWGWKNVSKYFLKSECWNGFPKDLRGSQGPIKTALGRYSGALSEAFLEAGKQAGYEYNPDYNGVEQEGFCRVQFTHTHGWPRRCSTARAYVAPAKHRRNLVVWTRTRALRLLFEKHRAVGVELATRQRRIEVRAQREVILSAGAYQSPQLLMLSGVGDPSKLSLHGIRCNHELSGVGMNLQDHMGSCVQHRCKKPITYYSLRSPLKLGSALIQLGLSGGGPLSAFPMTTMAFVKSSPKLDRPDIQIHLFPAAVSPIESAGRLPDYHGYNIHWCVLRPKSRGHVSLRSSNPFDPPQIVQNCFAAEEDKLLNRYGFHLARRLHAQKAFDDFRGPEVEPGSDCQTNAHIDAFMRRMSNSHFHPVGTCKMGTDELSVVDPQLRVHGLQNLRVADASIMPRLIGGNTNAAAIMIGEKAADLIRRG
jgi:choline dehydrogenase